MRLIGLAVILFANLILAPLSSEAQQPLKIPRIGLFHVGLDHDPPGLAPLRESLRRMGYEEGRNVRLDYRNQADEDAARATARAFVRERVDLMVAFENQAVRAAQAATSEIPVVFAHVSDPVAAGFVKSMARPGGNLTGVADFVGELQDKRIQTFGEMVRLRRLICHGHETVRLLSHEFRHVYQYEQAGSVAAFLPGYLLQIVERGYTSTTFEIDARAHERTDL